jgi:hypothetical protein
MRELQAVPGLLKKKWGQGKEDVTRKMLRADSIVIVPDLAWALDPASASAENFPYTVQQSIAWRLRRQNARWVQQSWAWHCLCLGLVV